MVRRVIETLIDDLDGSKAAETVRFAFGSGTYEIDLSSFNADALRRELAPYVAAGRKVPSARPAAKVPAQGGGSKAANAAIREWASIRGMPVKPAGRIPTQVVEAYRNRSGLERAQDDSTQAEIAAVAS